MDRVCHRLPPLDLRIGPQARRERPAEPFPRNAGRFGNDQPGGGALTIIFDRKRTVDAIAVCAAAGERRHDNMVGQGQRAKGQRVEQVRHERSDIVSGTKFVDGPT